MVNINLKLKYVKYICLIFIKICFCLMFISSCQVESPSSKPTKMMFETEITLLESTKGPVLEPTTEPVLDSTTESVIESTTESEFEPITILKLSSEEGRISFRTPADALTPTMSDDGKWIAYPTCHYIENSQGIKNCKFNVWVINLSNFIAKPLFTEKGELLSGLLISFSPNSRYLAVATVDSVWFFDTMDWNNYWRFSINAKFVSFSWAPDSQAIAVQTFENGNILTLLTLDGSQTPILQIEDVFPNGFPPPIQYPAYDWGPTWSPDGKEIAYLEYNEDFSRLWTVDISTGGKVKLCEGQIGDNPKWSPKGNNIALVGFGLKIYNFQTQSLDTVLENPKDYLGTFISLDNVWSPNGNEIVMNLDYLNQDTGLYILNILTRRLSMIERGYIDPYVWTDRNFILVENLTNALFEIIPVGD